MTTAAQIFVNYPTDCQPLSLEHLGSAGGFSGATFWRVQSQRGLLCLRRWPVEFPDKERLSFIHAVLEHVHRRGFARIPVPIRTIAGPTFVCTGELLWELSQWLPGKADFLPQRKPAKLAVAMRTLAQWHLAAADFPLQREDVMRSRGPSPGIFARLNQLNRLESSELGQIKRAVAAFTARSDEQVELQQLARRLLVVFPKVAAHVRPRLSAATRLAVPLQPCIRDVWHDHVLFDGDDVSGLIDFGALRFESVAGDVARLLDSMVADDFEAWQAGLAAYQAVRPLSRHELKLVAAFDGSLALLSGANWLDWVFLQRRTFTGLATIVERLRNVVERLEVYATIERSQRVRLAVV